MELDAIAKEIERRQAANYNYVYLTDRPGNITDKDNCIVHPVKQRWRKNIAEDKEEILSIIEDNPNPPHPYRLGFQRKMRGFVDVVRISATPDKTLIEAAPNDPTLEDFKPQIQMDNTVRSFEEALADKARIAQLEYMVRERDRQISELQEELEYAVSEAQDTEAAAMADGTVGLINQIAPLLPALADRYFSILEAKHKGAPTSADQRRPAPTDVDQRRPAPTDVDPGQDLNPEFNPY